MNNGNWSFHLNFSIGSHLFNSNKERHRQKSPMNCCYIQNFNVEWLLKYPMNLPMKLFLAVKEENDSSLIISYTLSLNSSFQNQKLFIGNSSFLSHQFKWKVPVLFILLLTNALRAFVNQYISHMLTNHYYFYRLLVLVRLKIAKIRPLLLIVTVPLNVFHLPCKLCDYCCLI